MARNPKKKKRSKAAKSRKNASNAEASLAPVATKVWRPGVDDIEDGEELQFDPSAYDCLFAFQLGWPCLSFDIIRDALGGLRSAFPHTMFCVAGTQAEVSADNAIVVSRLSNITGMKPKHIVGGDDESESDTDSSDDDEDSIIEAGVPSKNPSLQVRMVAHQGCVNRIRAMQQQPHVVATWSDTGYVQIWDVGVHVRSISSGSTETVRGPSIIRQAPLQIFTGHKEEGFSLDWNPLVPGRLVTGDCKSSIYLWEPSEGGRWNIENTPFSGHKSSVEDLQWSPTEAGVFASCSVDGTIAIWDVRSRSAAISVKAHDADINVISWNRLASCMIASGSDSGIFRIWDLRSFKDDSFIAHFKYHNAPITSIEWSPHDASTLATTSSDNQLTIWDLSLERDAEEEAAYQAQLEQRQADVPEDLPPQLLFVHQGQKDLKELHWHPQIHGLIVATSLDGFNVFKPSNLENIQAS